MRKIVFNTSLRSWAARNSRTLNVIGAFVIFLTFISKEGLKDRYKELASSVSTARTAFIVNRGIDETRIRVGEVQEELVAMDKERNLSFADRLQFNKSSTARYFETAEIADERQASEDFAASIENLEELLQTLDDPHNATLTRLEAVRDQLKLIAEKHQQMTDEEHTDAVKAYIKSLISNPYDDAKKRLWTLQIAGSPDYGLNVFSAGVLAEAERRKKRAENLSRDFGIASFALYAAGFLLGLVGDDPKKMAGAA